jgi:ABC-type sugar transport system permease subunit
MLMILPFWTSFLLRVYAWIGLLKNNGVINNVLLALGVIDPRTLTMMHTDFAVYIGIVYSYLPFMILPLYTNLEKHDQTLLEAAADLGARPMTSFLRITLPLSLPGIIAGSLLVFIPAVGEYVIPSLLGRTDQLMIGRVLSTSSSRTATGRWRVQWRSHAAAAGGADHGLPAHAEAANWRPDADARPSGMSTLGTAGLRLPVRADPVDDRLFLQQFAAGHRLGCGRIRRR